jgi:hypothetical protein
MEACDDGTAGAAIERVAEAHPGVSRDRVEEDVLGGLRDLLAKGIVRPALAPGAARLAADEPATADLAL